MILPVAFYDEYIVFIMYINITNLQLFLANFLMDKAGIYIDIRLNKAEINICCDYEKT